MKKITPLMLLLLVATLLNAQDNTKGYFINNEDQKIECTILDDVRSNPTGFTYKLPAENASKKADISTVKEFGVNNQYKYIRANVDIDRSDDEDLRNLSKQKLPEFSKEVLFLNVLVEGKGSLYQYENSGVLRFFYKAEHNEINQLVYKKYEIDGAIKENNSFREQLWTKLPCDKISMDKYNVIKYQKAELVDFFTDYNKCQNSASVVYKSLTKKAAIHLAIRPRINYTSFSAENSAVPGARVSNYDSKIQPGIGIEAEVLLPYSKHKRQWAVIAEPTFISYKADDTQPTNTISNGTVTTSIDYKALDLPFGFRYYLQLGGQSKVFINAVVIQTLVFNSSFTQTRSDGTELNNLNVRTLTNFAGGVGFKYGKSLSAELRYLNNRNVLGGYTTWNSKMSSVSLVVGYTLF